MKTRRYLSFLTVSGLAALSGLIALLFILSSCEGYENVWMTRIIERGKRGEAHRRGDYEDYAPPPPDPYPGYSLIPVSDLTYTPNPATGPVTITGYTGDGGKVIIPANIDGYPVTAIGSSSAGTGPFADMNLTGVVIPNTVTFIGYAAFYKNQLAGVTIPSSVKSIAQSAFMYNQLTGVTIPDSVTSIGNYAFRENQLTSVTIGSGVTSIAALVFYGNQLTGVTIPAGVTYIGSIPFAGNPMITSVTFNGNVTTFIGGLIGDDGDDGGDGNLLTEYAVGGPGTYKLASGTGAGAVWIKQP